MAGSYSAFTGSIPEHYDRGLGPLIFVDYAADLAARVAVHAPSHVLELAAGTGILTRALCDALPKGVHLTASDLNEPMLAVAGRKFAPGETVAFRAADACDLPFEAGAFDCLVCQFGVMFFPDKDLSYREAWRVLKSGGRYIFSVWEQLSSNPFARIAHETVAGFFEADPPRFYEQPFHYHDRETIRASLKGAGFADIAFEDLKLEKEIASTADFARGLVYGNPVIEEIRDRGRAPAEEVTDAVAKALMAAFGEPGKMTLTAIIFEARKV